jgi:ABC-type branched-subunit amino acid transport system ATPase component
VIRQIAERADIVILFLDQYFNLPRQLADNCAITERGEIVRQ